MHGFYIEMMIFFLVACSSSVLLTSVQSCSTLAERESRNKPTGLFTGPPFTINNGLIKEMLSDQPESSGQ